MQDKLERLHEDLKSLIPAAKASAMFDGDEDETATSKFQDGLGASSNFEIEYVGMDESLIGANGRVSF